MATAVGDLVATLGVENQQFIAALNESGASLDEFSARTDEGTAALERFEEKENESGVGATASARSFGFLGKQIKEMGEGLSGTNSELGETVSGLGSTVSGLGEAAHGYHALHTAIEVATGAQVMLNSITPVGWATMAAGAIAAAGAYLWWADSKKKAADAAADLAAKQEREKEAMEKATAALKEHNAIEDQIARKERELSQFGMTAEQKYVATFTAEHPTATGAELDTVRQQAERESAMKIQADMEKQVQQERLSDTRRLAAEVKSLTEGPMDKFIEQARDLQSGLSEGLISQTDYDSAIAGLQRKAAAAVGTEPAKAPEAIKALEFNSAEAYEAIYKAQHPEQQTDHQQRTADNTAKMTELLDIIRQNTANHIQL